MDTSFLEGVSNVILLELGVFSVRLPNTLLGVDVALPVDMREPTLPMLDLAGVELTFLIMLEAPLVRPSSIHLFIGIP